MATVVREGVAREHPAHESRQPLGPTPEQQVGVGREERPGVEGCPGCRGDIPQPGEEHGTVLAIGHNLAAFNPPEDDVVQRAGGIEPCLSGHRRLRPPSWIGCSLSGIFH